MQGKVKWYSSAKRYGFITPDHGGGDVFVHISALEDSGLRELQENQRVQYDLDENKGKSCAVNLKIVT